MKFHNYFSPGSAEYVILHAYHSIKKGRNPSLPFSGNPNPAQALLHARSEITCADNQSPMLENDVPNTTLNRISEILGTRRLYVTIPPVAWEADDVIHFRIEHYPQSNTRAYFQRKGRLTEQDGFHITANPVRKSGYISFLQALSREAEDVVGPVGCDIIESIARDPLGRRFVEGHLTSCFQISVNFGHTPFPHVDRLITTAIQKALLRHPEHLRNYSLETIG